MSILNPILGSGLTAQQVRDTMGASSPNVVTAWFKK